MQSRRWNYHHVAHFPDEETEVQGLDQSHTAKHVCLLRTSGPERAFWVPESGTNMNYSATWEKEIYLGVMAAIPKAKY